MQFRQDAGPDERFAPGAFAGSVGKSVPLRIEDYDRPVWGVLVAAEVVEDGRSVQLTVEVGGAWGELLADGSVGALSVGFAGRPGWRGGED